MDFVDIAATVIKTKYPDADFVPQTGNVELYYSAGVITIRKWLLPDPQPTIAELEEYAASPEYLADWGAKLKAEATETVNTWAEGLAELRGVMIPYHFYPALVASIAFDLLAWIAEGRPAEPDPTRFAETYAEVAAYREAHAGTGNPEEAMTAAQLLAIQEAKWAQMQKDFVRAKRRLLLEKIKLAPADENLPGVLATILAGLA